MTFDELDACVEKIREEFGDEAVEYLDSGCWLGWFLKRINASSDPTFYDDRQITMTLRSRIGQWLAVGE